MSFDLEVIRPKLILQIAELCQTVGLQPLEYPINNPQPPTVQIMGVGHITYDIASQRGGDQNDVLVQAFASEVSDIGGHKVIDKLIKSSGSTSMKEAIEKRAPGQNQVTLDGAIDDLRVVECMGHQIFTSPMPGPGGAALRYVGSTWVVQIETTE